MDQNRASRRNPMASQGSGRAGIAEQRSRLLRGLRAAVAVSLAVWVEVAFLGGTLLAQPPLTLAEAIQTALGSHPAIEAAEAAVRQADAEARIAGSGRLPRLSFTESYMRSNNPVFVFGSLLNQRRFGPANFEIDRLNNPESVQNFQSLLRVEQNLFDFRRTKHALRAARLRSDLSEEEKRAREADVILGVVRAYFGATLAEEKLGVAIESIKTAESDLSRTQALHGSGMATEADVLSAQVQLARVQEERIRAANDVEVSRAALNEVMGLAQSGDFRVVTPLQGTSSDPGSLQEHLRQLEQKPDLRQATIGEQLAQEQTRSARSDLRPRIVLQGILEADRRQFASQGGGNWLAGISFHWDIWKGSEGRARVAASRHAEARSAAQRKGAVAQAELQVRRAYSEVSSAEQRVSVTRAAVDQARESHRIIENRYEAGLEGVTELIRSQEALLQARFRHLAALHDQRVSRAVLEHAAGSLTPTSEALQ